MIRSNETNDKGKTARTHRTYQISKSVQAIAGGKYTTFRTMAQEAVSNVCSQLGKPYSKSKTISPLRQKSTVVPFMRTPLTKRILQSILENEMPKCLEDLVHRRIGINSNEQWETIYPEISFTKFFKENLGLINNYFNMKENEIDEYFTSKRIV